MPLSVPDICDRHAEQIAVCDPLFRDFGGRQRFCGRIVTIKCFEDNSLVREAVARPGENSVLVVDGGGSLRRALLGDLLAARAAENGWQGIVINGCVRDVEILRDIDIGIKALAAHPMKTDKRGEGQEQVPVGFAGLRMEPGQFLYADANGIAVAGHDLNVDF